MSPNPREHDLADLRRLARASGERGPAAPGRPPSGRGLDVDPSGGGTIPGEGPGARSAVRAGLYRELLPLEATTGAEKPYLQQLPEDVAAEELLLEWLDHLLGVGFRQATEALEYYESIGWISPPVRRALGDYLRGLEAGDGDGSLTVDDHVLSLVYVAKLSVRGASPDQAGDGVPTD